MQEQSVIKEWGGCVFKFVYANDVDTAEPFVISALLIEVNEEVEVAHISTNAKFAWDNLVETGAI